MPRVQTSTNDIRSTSEPVTAESNHEMQQDLRQPLLIQDDEASSASQPLQAQPRPSPNLKYAKMYTFFAFAGRSIWNQNVLATFVYLLRNNDAKSVGYITACMGLAQMGVSFPAGYLADRYRRDTLLRFASLLGLLAAAITIVAVQYRSYLRLVAALTCWGLHWGVANTCLNAIFADSMQDGERAKQFTSRSIYLQLGNLAGPLLCLGMFLYLGDTWTLRDCTVVLAAGQLVAVPSLVLLWLLSDDNTVPHEDSEEADSDEGNISDSEQSQPEQRQLQQHQQQQQQQQQQRDSELQRLHSASTTATENGTETAESPAPSSPRPKICCIISSNRRIPMCVALSDVMAGLASGMSIRYIAIFLYDNVHLSPAVVQILYVLSPILQSVLMKSAEYISANHLGRCRTTVLFKWIGITLMFGMIVSYQHGMPAWFICALLVTRTSFMNSTRALTKSIVMDHVPRKERAKWSALESVNMFSWSGSAVLGGILVGMQGILFNFCITATLQFFATFPIISLFSVLDERRGNEDSSELESSSQGDSAGHGVSEGDDVLLLMEVNDDDSSKTQSQANGAHNNTIC